MHAAVEAGLVVAGVTLAVTGARALAMAFATSPVRRLERADRWARKVDIALPPELVDPLAERLRRRGLARLAAEALLAVPTLGWAAWRFLTPPASGAPGDLPEASVMSFYAVLACVLALPTALAHLWEVGHEQRRPGVRVDRLQRIDLRDAVPGQMVWMARVGAALAPVVALATPLYERHYGFAKGLGVTYDLECSALLCLAALAVFAVERLQMSVLNGRQTAGSWPELAFDEAFRVRAALSLAPIAPAVTALALSPLLTSAFRAVPSGSVLDLKLSWPLIQAAWMWCGLMAFILAMQATKKQVHQYYRSSKTRRRGWRALFSF